MLCIDYAIVANQIYPVLRLRKAASGYEIRQWIETFIGATNIHEIFPKTWGAADIFGAISDVYDFFRIVCVLVFSSGSIAYADRDCSESGRDCVWRRLGMESVVLPCSLSSSHGLCQMILMSCIGTHVNSDGVRYP